MTVARSPGARGVLLGTALALASGLAAAKAGKPSDPLEPARAALRTLQFDQAVALLTGSPSPEAQYLLALMYLNGVGVSVDAEHGRALLRSAAEHGHGPAAYVLAAELGQGATPNAEASRDWLEKSAKLGYYRAMDALKTGRPLLDRETVGQSDPALIVAWVIDSVRRNDAAELRRIGPVAASIHDEFARNALSHAAESGADAAATALLELGADVRAVDRGGVTALMIAAERNDATMLELLLQHGADAQARDLEMRSALFYAARANQVQSIDLLAHAGTPLDARDSRGYNALDAALAVGADPAATALRSLGLHANRVAATSGRQTGKFDAEHPGELYRGWPPLALAISRNDSATVRQLLEAGADANTRLASGDTLLQVAAEAHALPCVALLLAHRADVASADHSGHGVLWLAVSHNDEALVHALIDGGARADTHVAGESTPLILALTAGHASMVDILLDAGASVDATDARGRTPLMLAAASGSTAAIKKILAHRAQPDALDAVHRSALWYAAAAGSSDAVELLLAGGASAKGSDARGASVLHAAAAQTNAGVVERLLAAGAPINGRDALGDTPLVVAAASGGTEVVKVLLSHRPDLNLQNGAGDTALIAASRAGHTAVCHLLVGAGADKSLRNSAGVSAVDVASGRGFGAIAADLGGKG